MYLTKNSLRKALRATCALLLSLGVLSHATSLALDPLPKINGAEIKLPWAKQSPSHYDLLNRPLLLFNNAADVATDVEKTRGNHQEKDTHLEKDSVANLMHLTHQTETVNRDAPTYFADYLDLRAFPGTVTLAALVDDQVNIKVTRMEATGNGNFTEKTEFETLINGNALWRPQSFRCLPQHPLKGGHAYKIELLYINTANYSEEDGLTDHDGMNLYAFINFKETPKATLIVNETTEDADDLVLVKHQNTPNPPTSTATLQITPETLGFLPAGAKQLPRTR